MLTYVIMSDQHIQTSLYTPVPDSADLGPAMRKLSPQQRAWVQAYLDTGCKSAAQAARMAGYSATGGGDRVTGHRLVHNEDVLAAIKELADKKVRTGAYVAMAVLLEIAENPTHKDRLKAAIEIANRSGMIVAQKIDVEHKHTTDAKEVLAEIRALAKDLGLNAVETAKLIGNAGYTDAEFQVVTPALTDAREPAIATAEGLEDLL